MSDTMLNYACGSTIFAALLITAIMIWRDRRDSKDEKQDVSPFAFPMFVTAIFTAFALSGWVFYFGMPPLFTFGYRLGQVATGVCMPNDPTGLPCTLGPLTDWTVRFLRGQEGGEWSALEGPAEQLRRLNMVYFGLLAFFWTVMYVLEIVQQKQIRMREGHTPESKARCTDPEMGRKAAGGAGCDRVKR